MKVVTRRVYTTDDGEEFDTLDRCRDHEAKRLLAGATAEQLEAALTGKDTGRGEALERLGRQCTANRIARGGSKRQAVAEAPAETSTRPVEQPGPPDNELDPAYRGDRDFKAGKPGMVPEDLKTDPAKTEAWLAAWDAASVASARAKDGRAAA